MLRRFRETAPAALVPFAWTVVAAAHLGAVTTHAIFVAHVVMSALLGAFVVTGWTDMSGSVLRVWRTIIAAGFGATTLGVGGFVADSDPLLAVSLYAWMVLPALGLLFTGRASAGRSVAYLGGGLVTALGTAVYAVAPSFPVVGIGLVGVGQTAGIAVAVARN